MMICKHCSKDILGPAFIGNGVLFSETEDFCGRKCAAGYLKYFESVCRYDIKTSYVFGLIRIRAESERMLSKIRRIRRTGNKVA